MKKREVGAGRLLWAVVVGLGLTVGLLLAFSRGLPTEAKGLDEPVQPLSSLQLEVNYYEDWVAGVADLNATVVVTLTDGGGAVKAEALVTADGGGEFSVTCQDWFSGECPDILPGDRLLVWANETAGQVNPIGAILVDHLDVVENTASGVLHVSGYTGTVDIRCEIWEAGGPTIETQADADGGSFSCDFGADAGWDLYPGHRVALRYVESDGDSVITMGTWPWMRVGLGHDWVGGDYPAGHALQIALYDDLGALKATAVAESGFSGGWGGTEGFSTGEGDWSPATPDIAPGDQVHIAANDGYTHTVEAGTIVAAVDAANDRVSGQIWASFGGLLPVECHPWGAWDAGIDAPIKESAAAPDGSVEFLCEWDPATEWDVKPGQEIAVMYVEPDLDRVIDVFEEPAPYLRIEQRVAVAPAEGGNIRFEIEVSNEGSGAAEDVVVTDVMEGFEYIADTAPVPHGGSGSGPIVWELGLVGPGVSIPFSVFAEVTEGASQIVTNTVSVSTGTGSDQGEPWERMSTWVAQVMPNDTYLRVEKRAWTENPAPGEDVVFAVTVCNAGSTGSSEVTLTDQLHPLLSPVNWWAYEPGWGESARDDGELVVTIPSLDADSCSEVFVRAHLTQDAPIGEVLTNAAVIAAANDLSPDDNEAWWEGEVDVPQLDVRIHKTWVGGRLVPGGHIRYHIHYHNDGNVPAGPLLITDTFPVSTTFGSAWHDDPFGGFPFEPVRVDDVQAAWEIPELLNGAGGEFELTLLIDPAAEPGTPLVNLAEISPLPDEVDYGDNVAGAATEVYPMGQPNLFVTKEVEAYEPGGEVIAYRIRFGNYGDEVVHNVHLTDTLPAGTSLEWHEVGWEAEVPSIITSTSAVAFVFESMEPGASGEIGLGVRLDDPDAQFLRVTNVVAIDQPEGDARPDDNWAVCTVGSGEWGIFLPLVVRDY